MSWINGDKLIDFILKAQGFETFCIPCGDVAGGGIADRPGNMVDIFHTFFGICGLSLLGYFKENNLLEEGIVIEPTYALPKALVEKLGLPSQKLPKV
jgi:geranylgeranyl transferase type-2 subunit beta